MLRFTVAEAAQDNSAHGNDGYAIDLPEDLLVVCDGVSGVNGDGKGAATAFVEKFRLHQDIKKSLRELIDEGTHKTTIVIAHIRDDILEICSVGDSRAYLVRGASILPLTKDHNLYAMIADKLPWKGECLDSEEIRELLLQGFSQDLVETIAEHLLDDKTKNIFLPRRMKRLLEDFKRGELFETCEREQKERGSSETFLAEVIRISQSFLIHHLSNPNSKSAIKILKAHIDPDDEVLLTTDGLHGSFADKKELHHALRNTRKISGSTAEKILQTAQENPKRRKDDMTVIYARVGNGRAKMVA